MTNKELVVQFMLQQGCADALALRSTAASLSSTAVIAQEHRAPLFDGGRDYSGWPVGAPVRFGQQTYSLIQPHDAAHFPEQTPATLPALWRVLHTTDPKKAKPWVQPASTSDLYLQGECIRWTDGTVYRAVRDTNFSPAEYAADWAACDL